MKKALLVASVQSHIAQFHRPLIRVLNDAGYQIDVAARDNLAEKNGLVINGAHEIFDVPFARSPFKKQNLFAYREIRKLIRDGKYDLISCNTPVAGVLTRLAARQARKNGTKVYYTAHGFHFYTGAPLKNWLAYYPIEWVMAYFTDRLITITEEDYQRAKRHFHTDVRHIHGVGVDTNKFHLVTDDERRDLRIGLGLDPDRKILFTIGELLPNKNQKTAILAMKEILQQFPDSLLMIAGNGPERESLRKLVRENNLERNIVFLDYTVHAEDYMNAADILIACSYREGLPLNLMEAMLCGRPIVASDNRGHRELVKEGMNGYLADPDRPVEFADKVCSILKEDRDYTADALKCVEAYTDTQVCKELKEVYECL